MKSKILFIMHMPPPVHGAAMVGKYIHDSKLINGTFECLYINASASNKVDEVGKVSVGKLIFMLHNLWKIIRTVKKKRPAVVYYTPTSDGWGIYRDMVTIGILKILGSNILLHMHNKGCKTYSDNHKMSHLAYRAIFANVKVILLAETLYSEVSDYVKREDVFICPNGIFETLNVELQIKRYNEIPHLLFLSNLLETKGVLVLLDALAILKEKGYSFFCDFVGGESAQIDSVRFERETLQRGINQVVTYHGVRYGDEKNQFFRNADIFVFPTYFEAFGLVAVEAMEYKLPVIGTNEGGLPDIISDGVTGLISEKRSPESLANCIERLLNDKELCIKMGENGYKKFKKYFTLNSFEHKFTEIIMKVVKQKEYAKK